MLAREYLREHADEYRVALKNRGASVDIERFLELDAERRRTIAQVEALKNQRNVASQEIAQLKKNKPEATRLLKLAAKDCPLEFVESTAAIAEVILNR